MKKIRLLALVTVSVLMLNNALAQSSSNAVEQAFELINGWRKDHPSYSATVESVSPSMSGIHKIFSYQDDGKKMWSLHSKYTKPTNFESITYPSEKMGILTYIPESDLYALTLPGSDLEVLRAILTRPGYPISYEALKAVSKNMTLESGKNPRLAITIDLNKLNGALDGIPPGVQELTIKLDFDEKGRILKTIQEVSGFQNVSTINYDSFDNEKIKTAAIKLPKEPTTAPKRTLKEAITETIIILANRQKA